MKAARNLSEFWRYDRSDDVALELVSILQGADSLIGNMGSEIQVTWSGLGVSYTDLRQRIVALDYGPLSGQPCPFPGSAVDEVIGYAAHEGGHCLWSLSDREQVIRREVVACWNSLPSPLRREWQAQEDTVLSELCRIQNILEDAYVDHQMALRWPVLAEYIHIARSQLQERTPLDLNAIASAECPDRKAVINLWASASLYGQPLPAPMSPPVKRAMEALLDFTQKVQGEGNAQAREAMAVPAASALWRELPAKKEGPPLQPLAKWAVPQQGKSTSHDRAGEAKAAQGQASPLSDPGTGQVRNLDDFDPCPGPGGGGRKVTPLPEKLRVAVAQALAHEVEDLSLPVAQALEADPRQVVARAKKGDYAPELARRVLAQVQREIRETQQAFRQQQGRNSRWLHGVEQGKLDDRRLWKAGVGDPAYRQRHIVPGRPNLAVGLLLDVSASMSRHLSVVQQTAAVFFQGLTPMPGINFAAWCYSGQLTRVALTRICDRQLPHLCLANVEQGGNTPSGAAIAAAKTLMERMPESKRLLIHFTDGRPDSPIQVLRAVQACRQAGIQAYAIALHPFQDMLHRQYGEGNYETIQSISELPRAVARIVKRLAAYQ